MIYWPIGALGAALLLLTMGDVLHTTLGQGGGFLSTRITSVGWRAAATVSERRQSQRLLATAGVMVVVSIVLFWMLSLWIGWTMIFCGSPDAVVVSESHAPAGIVDRFAFTGWVMVTLGTPGHLESGGLFWDVLVPISTGNGFFILTLAIAYLLPLVSAATQTRQLALSISVLGGNAITILRRAWDGEGFAALDQHLRELIVPVTLLAERHLTYPALHYLHSIERSSAIAPCLATLDETLTVLEHVRNDGTTESRLTRESLRRAISEELSTLRAVYFDPAEEPPPVPDVERLRRLGVPLDPDDVLSDAIGRLAARRSLLRAFVENDGWNWNDVCQPDPLPEEEDPEPGKSGSHGFF